MEPRPLERGSSICPATTASLCTASMEPRPLERGVEAPTVAAREQRVASMEPRPLERGSFLEGLRALQLPALQWSRALSSADRLAALITNAQNSLLQWSRALSSADR